MLNQLYILFPHIVIDINILLYGSELLSKYDNVKIARVVENYIFESGRFRIICY